MPPDEVEHVARNVFGELRGGMATQRMGKAVRLRAKRQQQRVPGEAEQEQRRAVNQHEARQQAPLPSAKRDPAQRVPVPRRDGNKEQRQCRDQNPAAQPHGQGEARVRAQGLQALRQSGHHPRQWGQNGRL